MQIVFAMLFLLGTSAWAQTSTPTPTDSRTEAGVTQYSGADRTQRLIDGARREGGLKFYTSMAENDSARLAAGFEKKYGIKVTVWRAGKHKVLQRVIAEAAAGRNEADVVGAPSPEMEALHREKLLQRVRSPMQKDQIAAALPAHGEWTGMRVNVFVQAFNTQKVSRDELPRTFEQLLNPRWKGRLGIEAKAEDWFYMLMQSMGEEKGLRFFRELVKTNQLSVRTGNSLLTNMVVSGEVPFALTTYTYLVDQSRAKGAPIDYIALSPTIAHTDGIGITRAAPHPHAATLFYDYLLSDGQKMMSERFALTTNRRDEAALARLKPTFVDPARILDNAEKWARLFEDTLQIGSHPPP